MKKVFKTKFFLDVPFKILKFTYALSTDINENLSHGQFYLRGFFSFVFKNSIYMHNVCKFKAS